jgi:hypothetical protein
MVILAVVDMISGDYGGVDYFPPNENGKFALNATAFLVGDGSSAPPPVVPLPPAALSALTLLVPFGGKLARRRMKK